MRLGQIGIVAGILLMSSFAFGEVAADQQDRIEFVQQLAEESGEPWTANNHVELLDRGQEFFPRRIEMIRNAEETIDLITFNWCDDEAGKKVARELGRARDRGVRVRLIVDYFNVPVKRPFGIYRKLQEEGLNPLVFNPPSWGWGGLEDRIHEKMMVVDGQESLIGGANLCDGYQGLTEPSWQEFELYVKGPLNVRVQGHFDRTWNRMAKMDYENRQAMQREPRSRSTRRDNGHANGPTIPPRYSMFEPTPTDPPEAGDAPALFLYQQNYFDEMDGIQHRDIYESLIERAEQRVILYSAFFIPPDSLIDALIEAAEEGVQVQIYTNSAETNDHSTFYAEASRARFGELVRAGVEIYQAQEAMTHAKGLLIDRHYLTIGSHNFTRRSFEHNGESKVLILDREAISKFEDAAARNFEAAELVELEEVNGANSSLFRRSQDRFNQWMGRFF